MPRVIKRQITTIKIVSVELTWSDEAEPADVQPVLRALPEGDQKAELPLGKPKRKGRRQPAGQKPAGRKPAGQKPDDPSTTNPA